MELLKLFNCETNVPVIDGVYQFTDDIPISLDGDKPKYLGYEKVGANFQPDVSNTMPVASDEFGAYGASARLAVKFLSKGCTILDLGAGLGAAAIPLALYGSNVIAVDISQEMLRHAAKTADEKSITDNLLIARMNAYELKFKDHVFDAVLVIDLMQQLEHPEIVFDEIRRVLKPDGVYLQYSSAGLPITDDQKKTNDYRREVWNDINDYYHKTLDKTGYVSPVSFYSNSAECMERNLELIGEYVSEDEYIWTGAMAKDVHKLKNRANGHSQLIPDDIHDKVWNKTDLYARTKYGDNYADIPNYSHFTGMLYVYKLK